MLKSSFVFLVALSIGLNGFAANTADINEQSIQSHFDSYMIQNISSEDYANELVGNPPTFEATVQVIKAYIKSKDSSYNDLQKARILVLDKTLERTVRAYNAKTSTNKRMVRRAGAVAGAVAFGALGSYRAGRGNIESQGIGNYGQASGQIAVVLTYTGFGIYLGGIAGYMAGNAANEYQGPILNPQDLVEQK